MMGSPRALALLLFPCLLLADGLIPPLNEKQAAFVRKTLDDFKANPRGPYLRIRWFCADGSVLPPDGTPCRGKGGGNQHAELSPAGRQLAAMNIHTGTILTGLDAEQLIDAEHDHHWLKELVLEKFLIEVNQAWIYRKAASYRGARQIEDEEKAGRALLVKILSDPAWVARNYFLAQQLVDTIPHGVPDLIVKRIRNLASISADGDARFQLIRAKIHSYPGPEDLASVREFLKAKQPGEPARKAIEELAALLEKQNQPAAWVPNLRMAQKRLGPGAVSDAIDALAQALGEHGLDIALQKAGVLTLAIQQELLTSNNGRRNLQLLDLNGFLQDKAFELRQPVPDAPRRNWIEKLGDHIRMATGAGLLSNRQMDALLGEIQGLLASDLLPPQKYRSALQYLGRATEWSHATVAKDFGPLARHYESFEPAAKPLVDHLLRGSAALPMTNLLEGLLLDADRAVGLRHMVFGQAAAGVVGLNPGVAVGKLGILEAGEEGGRVVDPRGIYVIPQTASDLKPMAGMLTLDSGNLLSHAQLLAANLGIPNATIPSAMKPELEKQKGEEVFFAVTPRHVVLLKPKSRLSPEETKIWASQPSNARRRIPLDTSRLRLEDTRLRRLTEVNSKDSGVLCGPKAANLGQLASYFPDKVAAGIVVPFGVFRAHIARDLDGSGTTLEQQISNALSGAEKMLEEGTDPALMVGHTYPQLARFRKMIESMPLLPEFERELRAKLEEVLGPDRSYGAFVRSDTNAEDLPEFTGAGLNLTVPNQVGFSNIVQAVRSVWASPFTERAFDWRTRALSGTHRVYPSVIVMRTIPSDKSGVIATADLETGDQSYTTVNASEGTSAVVDGGVAESILLAPDGAVRLLQQCRATYRKVAKPTGGFVNLPPLGGNVLLDTGEVAQLRAMVAEVKRKYPAVKSDHGTVLPWDIEFGFEKGQLRLFQIRPLVRFQELATLEALARLESAVVTAQVRLSEKPSR